MTNTYEEISNKLKEFATNSAVVEEYQCDEFSRFTTNNHKYPLLWNTPVRMRVRQGVIEYVTQITVMDIVYKKTNMIETLSEASLTLAEIMAWLDDQSENCSYYLDSDADFQPFFRQVDNVTGWQGEVVFKTRYQADISTIRWKT